MTISLNQLPLTQLHAHPNNVRSKVEDIAELSDSIKAQGIIEPLIVAPHPEVKGEYVVIAGHRRLAAARHARITTAPCIVNTALKTEAQQVEAMLVENLQRVDISPVEEARAYQYLIDLDGYDVARLAKSTGRSPRTVKERLKLGKLSEGQAESLHDGALTLERALVLVEFQKDPKAIEQLERIPAREHSTWEVTVRRLQRARDWKASLPKLRRELEAAGAELIDSPEGPTYNWSEYSVAHPAEATFEENVAKGYRVIADAVTRHYWSGAIEELIWVKPRQQQAEHVRPEPTAEEIADEQRRQDINAALGIAAEVRETHVLEQLKAGSHPMARKAVEALIVRQVNVRRVAWALRMPWSEEYDEQEVFDRLPQLKLEQLVLLLHFDSVEKESRLLDLQGWDGRGYFFQHGGTGAWLTALQEVYGYTLSDPEKEALAYWPAPEPADSDDVDDDQDTDEVVDDDDVDAA